MGVPQSDIDIPAKRQHRQQNFVLRGIGKSWVGFRLVKVSRFRHIAFPLNPQFVGFSCLAGWEICPEHRRPYSHTPKS